MTLEEFRFLPSPAKLSRPLRALWHEAHAEWDRAHDLVQEESTAEAHWVHAYLHRKEGDEGNARYWYTLANRVKTSQGLDAEWIEIAETLLK